MVRVSGVPYEVELPKQSSMRYTFETDDPLEAKNLMNAQHMYSALWNIQEEARRIVKYNDLSLECQGKLEELRNFIYSETEGLIGD